MADIVIKKVLDHIYNLSFDNVIVKSGDEFIIDKGINEFVSSFKYMDRNSGIIMLPCNYDGSGLWCRTESSKELFSLPKYNPAITQFGFHFYGLKRSKVYRVTIEARTMGSSQVVTNNRELKVYTNDGVSVISEDLTDVINPTCYYGVFISNSEEVILNFAIGKIAISKFSIDEVELFEEKEEDNPDEVLEEGKIQLVSYGVFEVNKINKSHYTGKYIPQVRLTGKGINLYYNTEDETFVLERDNANDILGASFTTLKYLVDINTTKMTGNSGYTTKEVGLELSPNTLKQGYLIFKADGTTGTISVIINKIY